MGWQLGQSQRAAGPTGGPNRAELETSYFHFLTRCSKNMWETVLMYRHQSATVLSNWAESLVKWSCGKGKSDANNLFSKPYQHCKIFWILQKGLMSKSELYAQPNMKVFKAVTFYRSAELLSCVMLKSYNINIRCLTVFIYTFMYIHYSITGWIIDLFSLNKLKKQQNSFIDCLFWLSYLIETGCLKM